MASTTYRSSLRIHESGRHLTTTCYIFLIVVSCFPLMISLLSNSLYCILIQNVIFFLNIVVSYLMDSGESVSYDFISLSLNILF